MNCLVTGCAGFIGSNLVDRLLADGHEVWGIDNFSTGQMKHLSEAQKKESFHLQCGDLLDYEVTVSAMMGRSLDVVFHLAANADVRFGFDHPERDLEQNIIVTSNVLRAMRETGTKRILFSSTGSVYGEADTFPTSEDCPFPKQTSLYGASKVAAEGLISAYCQRAEFSGTVFRFVSILGERYTHGHVVDFYQQLKTHPDHLLVQGDGFQTKSYLYVQDCIDALIMSMQKEDKPFTVYNLGTTEVCTVRTSIETICEHMKLRPKIEYTGGRQGWLGDNPHIYLHCGRMRARGWAPKLSIRESILRTLMYLEGAK